jgi:diaminopimelate epimerase
VETLAGKRYVYTEWKGDSLQEVSVDLGAPEVEFFDRIIHVDGEDFPAVSVSFGNPHCVVMARELSDEYFMKYGSMLENHPLFPRRTNVEFVQVVDRCHIRMRTWERGCGETLSCASGSGAATVAAKLWGVCENEIMVEQKGGSIRCVWNERTDCVRAYSKAVVVFEGTTEETE